MKVVLKPGRRFRIGFFHEGREFAVDYNFNNIFDGLKISAWPKGKVWEVMTIVDKDVDGKMDDGFYGWNRSSIPKQYLGKRDKEEFQALFQIAMLGILARLDDRKLGK